MKQQIEEEQMAEYVTSDCRFCGEWVKFLVHFDNPDKLICCTCGYSKKREVNKQQEEKNGKPNASKR